MKVRCFNIQWDTEGDDPKKAGLPTDCELETDLPEDKLADDLADELSQEYGWVVNGVSFEVVQTEAQT